MKILWFTNTSCSFAKKNDGKSMSGGWMVALENRLNIYPNIELYISFYQDYESGPVKYGNTIYYPVFRKNNIVNKIKRRLFNKFSNDKKEIPKLLEIIEKIKPDIIHIHGTEDNFGLIQKYINQPIIISIQGIINTILGKFFLGIPKNILETHETLKSILTFSTFKRSYKMFQVMADREQKILINAKYIIGRTEWDRRVTSVFSHNCKYYHNNELLREEFYKSVWAAENVPRQKLNIITITNNNVYKGFETIIKTAVVLRNRQDINYNWDIIGLSENDSVVRMVISWLKVSIEDLNITLRGRLSPQKFIPLMLNSNIFCQVSHIENSSNSLCEAMCLGMPIIASNVGGTSSLLENNKEGVLIQDGDPYSLAGAILEFMSDSDKAEQMGENARLRAFARHNPDKVVADLIAIYKEVIKCENS